MDINLFNNAICGYVYLIEFKDSGEYYYGSRYANIRLGIIPEADLLNTYFTSSKSVKCMLASTPKDRVNAQIIFKHIDPNTLIEYEQSLIAQQFEDPLLLNKAHQHGATPAFRAPDTYKKAPCRYCTLEFGISGLAWHEQLCDLNPNQHIPMKFCQYCSRSTMSRMHKRHVSTCKLNPQRTKISHKKPAKAKCLYCSNLFSNGRLHSHIPTCSKNPNYSPQYACTFCNRDMHKKHPLIIHMKTCSHNPEYSRKSYTRARTVCEYCSTSISYNAYNRHIPTCQSNPNRIIRNPCSYCGLENPEGPKQQARHELNCEKNPGMHC